jgi:predicted nucleic acid-binding protein
VKLDSYVLDSSVLVASLIPSDRYYSEGSTVIRRMLGSDDAVFTSAIVPIEVSTAVARRARDQSSARDVQTQMAKWINLGRLRIVYLNAGRMRRSQEIGVNHYLRGMDSIVAQVAVEKKVPLITFDQKMAERISPLVKTITQVNFSEEFPLPTIEEEQDS